MNYVVPGDILARLLVAAGSRMDADEIGEIVHRIKAERTDIVMRYDGDAKDVRTTLSEPDQIIPADGAGVWAGSAYPAKPE